MKKVEVIPIVVGALGAVSKKLDKWIEKLGIHIRIELLQKTTLLGTARILRKKLGNLGYWLQPAPKEKHDQHKDKAVKDMTIMIIIIIIILSALNFIPIV